MSPTPADLNLSSTSVRTGLVTVGDTGGSLTPAAVGGVFSAWQTAFECLFVAQVWYDTGDTVSPPDI